jgi:hypothetical protein
VRLGSHAASFAENKRETSRQAQHERDGGVHTSGGMPTVKIWDETWRERQVGLSRTWRSCGVVYAYGSVWEQRPSEYAWLPCGGVPWSGGGLVARTNKSSQVSCTSSPPTHPSQPASTAPRLHGTQTTRVTYSLLWNDTETHTKLSAH